MRITKKFSGVSSIGKQVFSPKDNVDASAQEAVHKQLDELEKKFISAACLHPSKQLFSLAEYSINPPASTSLGTQEMGVAVHPLMFSRAHMLGARVGGPEEGVVQGATSTAAGASAVRGPFDVNVYLAQRQMQSFVQARAYALAQAHAFESYAVERAQMHDHSDIYSKTTSSIYANEAAYGRELLKAELEIKSDPFSVETSSSDRGDQNAPHLLLNFFKVASGHEAPAAVTTSSASTTSAHNIVEGLPILQGANSQLRANVNGSTSAETNSDSNSDSDKNARKSDKSEEQRSGPSASDISETSSEENCSESENGKKKKRENDSVLEESQLAKVLRPTTTSEELVETGIETPVDIKGIIGDEKVVTA